MKKQEKKPARITKVPAKDLLAQIAAQFRGKDIFPEKTEECKQFLRKLKGAKL